MDPKRLKATTDYYKAIGLDWVHPVPVQGLAADAAEEPAAAQTEIPAESFSDMKKRSAPAATAAAPSAPAALPGKPGETLADIQADLGDCERCKLSTTRTKIAFGEGNPKARLLFIGEGPGKDEDLQGRPFIGKAGQLLTKMIEAMGLKREDVYIANIVKCRPTVDLQFTKDRPPDPDETAACSPFLLRQIRAIGPEVVVTLGAPSTRFILNTAEGITKIRGKWHKTPDGIKVMPTFHPAYLLRDPNQKKFAWEDLKAVMRELGLPPPKN